MCGRSCHRGSWQGSRGRKADRRTCRLAGGPATVSPWSPERARFGESYLVGSGVSETGEEREESARDRGGGGVPEDDPVQVGSVLNLRVACQAQRELDDGL